MGDITGEQDRRLILNQPLQNISPYENLYKIVAAGLRPA
jgi:hypothetical protein